MAAGCSCAADNERPSDESANADSTAAPAAPGGPLKPYPEPIVGHGVPVNKPILQPRPGYVIIPDDRPGDHYFVALADQDAEAMHTIVMAGTSLSDRGLKHVPRFSALHTLDASNTAVTDEGLRNMQSAPALKVLAIRNTRVTDAGLEFLKEIKTLKSVDLTGTQVSDQGVERLRAARPDIQVIR